MKNSASSILALSLAFAVPNHAFADFKDAAIGAAIGAAINQGLNNAKKKSTSKASANKTKSSSNVAPGLNGQFSRAERKQIQTSLNGLGLNVGVVDGSLGPKSRAAISQFQGTRGEAQTGQLTREQFIALTGVGFSTLPVDRRLTQNEIVMMQQSLQRIGFYNSPIDGIDGQGMQNARASFLASRNLNIAQTTQIQSLVLAASAAGFQAPPYLVQEAQAQYAAVTNSQPFGTVPLGSQGSTLALHGQQQPNGQFGTPATTAGFGTQPQQNVAFGQPQGLQSQQNNGFGVQAPVVATQPTPLFGAAPQQQQLQAVPQQQQLQAAPQQLQAVQQQLQAVPQQQQIQAVPQQQQAVPQQQQIQAVPQQQQAVPQQQPLFAPTPQQQPLQAPIQQAPAQQGQALFAATGISAAQPQQEPQSSFDVFSLPNNQPEPAAQQASSVLIQTTNQQALQTE